MGQHETRMSKPTPPLSSVVPPRIARTTTSASGSARSSARAYGSRPTTMSATSLRPSSTRRRSSSSSSSWPIRSVGAPSISLRRSRGSPRERCARSRSWMPRRSAPRCWCRATMIPIRTSSSSARSPRCGHRGSKRSASSSPILTSSSSASSMLPSYGRSSSRACATATLTVMRRRSRWLSRARAGRSSRASR